MTSERAMPADRAAQSVWALLAFVAASVIVMSVVSRLFGPASLDGWYAEVTRPVWELPMPVRSTIWYVEALLVSAAAWMLWAYPQPGLRMRGVALVAVNIVLAAVVRPVLLALIPEHGAPAVWSLAAAVGVLAVVLAIAAVQLGRTHRVSALLIVPCIVWALYVMAINVALAAA